MTDSHSDNAFDIKQSPVESQQKSHNDAQNQNDVEEEHNSYTTSTAQQQQQDVSARAAAQGEAVKDQIDGAIARGPIRADQSSGGRVLVGETGDLHELAARRQSQCQAH